jgi:hypothetical protein
MEDREWKTAMIHYRSRRRKETMDARELIAKR